jgi:hypothetical protein
VPFRPVEREASLIGRPVGWLGECQIGHPSTDCSVRVSTSYCLSVRLTVISSETSPVGLEEEWDILSDSSGALGGPPGSPGFVMPSLDEKVALGGTTWHDSIGITRFPDPFNASAVRKYMEREQ